MLTRPEEIARIQNGQQMGPPRPPQGPPGPVQPTQPMQQMPSEPNRAQMAYFQDQMNPNARTMGDAMGNMAAAYGAARAGGGEMGWLANKIDPYVDKLNDKVDGFFDSIFDDKSADELGPHADTGFMWNGIADKIKGFF